MSFRSLSTPLLAVFIVATAVYSEWITAPHEPPGPIHIKYWEKWTAFEADAMRDVVDHFNRSQSRVHVDFLAISDVGNKTLMAVAGGDPPDVAGLWGDNVAQYADDEALTPLDDYCRKVGINRSQYIPVYFDFGFYNGHVYALPSAPASTALHYNRAEFRAAGLDPNKPPQTIEELDAMCDRLTIRKNGRIVQSGFLPAEPGWWNWGWGYVFGGKLWDGKSKITANSPENVRAYDWVASFSRKYGAAALQTFRSGFGNFSSPQNAFLNSKVAMELQGVWMYNFINMYAPKLDWAAAPFPHPADRPDLADATFCNVDTLVIPRGARHPDEAFEFINYVQSPEGMERLCLEQRKHSPLARVSDAFLKAHPNPYIRLFEDLAKRPTAISMPKLGIWPEYQAEMNNAFDEIVLLKETPQRALDNVQTRMQAELDEYRLRLKMRAARQGNAFAPIRPFGSAE